MYIDTTADRRVVRLIPRQWSLLSGVEVKGPSWGGPAYTVVHLAGTQCAPCGAMYFLALGTVRQGRTEPEQKEGLTLYTALSQTRV